VKIFTNSYFCVARGRWCPRFGKAAEMMKSRIILLKIYFLIGLIHHNNILEGQVLSKMIMRVQTNLKDRVATDALERTLRIVLKSTLPQFQLSVPMVANTTYPGFGTNPNSGRTSKQKFLFHRRNKSARTSLQLDSSVTDSCTRQPRACVTFLINWPCLI
jgi:hypothetical protein